MKDFFQKNSWRIALILATFFGFLAGYFSASLESPLRIQASLFDQLKDLFSKKIAEIPLLSPSPSLSTSPSPYQPILDYEKQIINVVRQASPAVVSIIISKDIPILEKYFLNPFEGFPPEFQQFFGPFFEFSIPQYREKGKEKREVGGGTGFIISTDGLILTNKHVVNDPEASYTVFLNDGRKFEAQVLARDPSDDLALIKISATNLPTVILGDSNQIEIGQTAIAIGNALGEFRNTVSVGVISGLSRSIIASDEQGNIQRIENVIQTDAAINRGNSGGPLLNLKGEVIGVNTAMVLGAQNIGFAIPINRAKRVIESYKTYGKIVVPYLGIRYLLVDSTIQKKYNLPYDYGALIIKGERGEPAVYPHSPAEKAGLKEEDLILEFNHKKITLNNSLASLIQEAKVGEKVILKVYRQGKEFSLEVVLEERPANF